MIGEPSRLCTYVTAPLGFSLPPGRDELVVTLEKLGSVQVYQLNDSTCRRSWTLPPQKSFIVPALCHTLSDHYYCVDDNNTLISWAGHVTSIEASTETVHVPIFETLKSRVFAIHMIHDFSHSLSETCLPPEKDSTMAILLLSDNSSFAIFSKNTQSIIYTNEINDNYFTLVYSSVIQSKKNYSLCSIISKKNNSEQDEEYSLDLIIIRNHKGTSTQNSLFHTRVHLCSISSDNHGAMISYTASSSYVVIVWEDLFIQTVEFSLCNPTGKSNISLVNDIDNNSTVATVMKYSTQLPSNFGSNCFSLCFLTPSSLLIGCLEELGKDIGKKDTGKNKKDEDHSNLFSFYLFSLWDIRYMSLHSSCRIPIPSIENDTKVPAKDDQNLLTINRTHNTRKSKMNYIDKLVNKKSNSHFNQKLHILFSSSLSILVLSLPPSKSIITCSITSSYMNPLLLIDSIGRNEKDIKEGQFDSVTECLKQPDLNYRDYITVLTWCLDNFDLKILQSSISISFKSKLSTNHERASLFLHKMFLSRSLNPLSLQQAVTKLSIDHSIILLCFLHSIMMKFYTGTKEEKNSKSIDQSKDAKKRKHQDKGDISIPNVSNIPSNNYNSESISWLIEWFSFIVDSHLLQLLISSSLNTQHNILLRKLIIRIYRTVCDIISYYNSLGNIEGIICNIVSLQKRKKKRKI